MTRVLPFRVVPHGWHIALAIAILAIPAVLAGVWASLLILGLACGILWFFRDPQRLPPDAGILSPADGRVSVTRIEDERVRVGVFMNVTDVHVNRAPISGKITHVTHRQGSHRPAFSKDSAHNEQVRIGIEGSESIEVILIAGAFARRIFPYVTPGETVERGDRISHIAFGSRVDVICPPAVEIGDVRYRRGERVRAGESVLVD